MFEYIRDITLEISGIDSLEAKRERRDKAIRAQRIRYIFSYRARIIFFILGVIYIIIATGSIALYAQVEESRSAIVERAVLSLIDFISLIALMINKRSGEIVATAGALLFAVGVFISTVIA